MVLVEVGVGVGGVVGGEVVVTFRSMVVVLVEVVVGVEAEVEVIEVLTNERRTYEGANR